MLVENIQEDLNPFIRNLLKRPIVRRDNKSFLTYKGTLIEYNENFKLYLITKYPEPNFHGTITKNVVLVDFSITEERLQEQLIE